MDRNLKCVMFNRLLLGKISKIKQGDDLERKTMKLDFEKYSSYLPLIVIEKK